MNDLQQLHNTTDDAFARRLLDALPAMRFKFGDISQAIESDAGGAPVRTDAAGNTDARSGFGGCEGTQGVRGQV